MDLGKIWQFPNQQLQKCFIELDDGKIYRKALYLMVKTMVSGVDFPLNQSIECFDESLFNEWRPVDHQIAKDQSTYFPFSSCVSLNPSTDRMVISLYHYMSIHMNIYKCMLDLIWSNIDLKKKTYSKCLCCTFLTFKFCLAAMLKRTCDLCNYA
jgi:uncharacterized protein YjaG (DUF416 family)